MKVLLVEDEILVRRFMKTLIDWEANGFTVVGEAANGEEAWAFLNQHEANIVLTDIRMPILDGFQLIERMRSNDLPCAVVILSNYDDFEYVRTSLKLHVSDYIHKATVSGKELLDSLLQAKRDWLNRQEQTLYERSVSQLNLSRKGIVSANLLTMALEQNANPNYLDILSNNLEIWNEPFQAVLVVKDEFELSEEQLDGDMVIVAHEEYWIIAGSLGTLSLAAITGQSSIPASMEQLSFAEWPIVYQKLKLDLQRRVQQQEETRTLHVSVREAAAYMQEHYMDELTLEAMSEIVHVSPAYLSRLFQKESGTTFTEYLTCLRVNQAKSLLRHTQLPVYEIAERVGYRNSRYFLKLFKETEGITPTEFRDNKI